VRSGAACALIACLALVVACASRLEDLGPTPRPSPLPTRVVRSTATPEPPTPMPSPTARPVRRVFNQTDFDPYAALYVSEREGIYVTTRNPGGRFYYHWDDRRWMALTNRAWFRTREDLHTVFPNRQPAP
jgi:hypothetical protein